MPPRTSNGALGKLKDAGIIIAVVANVVLLVGVSTAITSKLDKIASRSLSNCVLLRSAIILGIEQSLNQGGGVPSLEQRQAAARLERTFQAVQCG